MEPITVLLADDHDVIRAGLRALLELEPQFRIVGEAGNGRQAVELSRDLLPDVVVMDHFMPCLNGFEAARQILTARPRVKLLILSAQGDGASVAEAARIGILGFMLKQDASQDLSEAILKVSQGKAYLSQSIVEMMKSRHRNPASSGPGGDGLSPASLSVREAEVLQLIAEGNTNKQIAAELGISSKTVEKHRHSLMLKLNIHETAGLTRYAMARGFVR